MDDAPATGRSNVAPVNAPEFESRGGKVICSICRRKLGTSLFFVEETGDVPEPRRSWVLCSACNGAVHDQLAQSPLRSPLRLRIAVGLVAAERTPEARRQNFGQLTDEGWAKLFFWLFPITMIVHLLIIVLIAGWFK